MEISNNTSITAIAIATWIRRHPEAAISQHATAIVALSTLSSYVQPTVVESPSYDAIIDGLCALFDRAFANQDIAQEQEWYTAQREQVAALIACRPQVRKA